MVEGTFARVFKSELQPVEVASAIQHEMDERAAIVARGRTLVPNDFVVEISHPDGERLAVGTARDAFAQRRIQLVVGEFAQRRSLPV